MWCPDFSFPSALERLRIAEGKARQSLPAPSKPFCVAGRRGSCRKSCADKGRRKKAAGAQRALGLKYRNHQLFTVLRHGLRCPYERGARFGSPLEHPVRRARCCRELLSVPPCETHITNNSARNSQDKLKTSPCTGSGFCFLNYCASRKNSPETRGSQREQK